MEISHYGRVLISVSAEDIIDGVCRKIPTGVTHIDRNAFRNCTGLTALTIPAGVTKIGYLTFAGCTRLTELTIPAGVTHIGEWAFFACTGLGLTEFTIPASVTHIGARAFQGCTGLTELTIPAGVTNIGEGTFWGCTGLTELTIPAGVTNIGDRAFEGCQALRAIIINGSEQEVQNIRGQLPAELRSRAISLETYNHVAEQIRQIRQEVLDSAEPIGSFGELPGELVKCINHFDERLYQAINREPLPAIDADLGDYKQRLEASLRVLARDHSISVAIEKLETLIGSIREARSTAETKNSSGFFTSNLELASAKIKVIEKLIDYLKGNVSEELSEEDRGLIEQIGVIKTILGTHEISLADLLQIPAQGVRR